MAYITPVLPDSGEFGGYNRAELPFFWTTRSFTWVWQHPAQAPYPRMRFLVDGAPATDWVTASAAGRYTFSPVNVENGQHLASVEVEGGTGHEILPKGFVVNDTGAPFPDQRPWTSINRFELNYGKIAPGVAQVPYSATRPRMWRMKPREIIKSSALPTDAQRWVRMFTGNNSAQTTRRFVELPTGDKYIEADQKYFYDDATSQGTIRPGLDVPRVTVRDGTRGVGTLGYVYKFVMRRGGKMAYFMETNGRFGVFVFEDLRPGTPAPPLSMNQGVESEIATLAGWRIKPGELKAHGGIKSAKYMYSSQSPTPRPEHQAFYESKWEHLGDWTQVPGTKRFFEPWGFAVARRKPDGTIDNRDGLEAWICDTLHHRILFANLWPAHPAFYAPAQFPPAGYVSPPAPTGKVHMAAFVGAANEQPIGRLINEPWDCAVNPRDGKLYWTNYAGNSISRANLDGTGVESVLECALNPTDAQLGVARRLWTSQASLDALRVAFVRDGPAGAASCVRPQGMQFNSEGKLVWVERYTYAVRELDLVTMTVRTVGLFPQILRGSSAAATNDAALWIDDEGTCGPQDDIYVSAWHTSDWQFSKDGVSRGHWAFTSGSDMTNGPLNKCDSPGYSWGVGGGDGRIVFSGNAAGWQCIEITRRLPTDPEPNVTLWRLGRDAYETTQPFYATHGPHGQGELGAPSMEEMGSWDDATLRAYATANGIHASLLDAFSYYVRWNTRDLDYTGEDMSKIAELEAALVAANTALVAVRDENAALTAERDALKAERDALKATAVQVDALAKQIDGLTPDA